MPLPLSAEWVKTHLPKRPATAHKGDFGRLVLLCGSACYPGAAALAAAGALRCGTGLVRLAASPAVCAAVAAQQPCCTYLPLPANPAGGVAAAGAAAAALALAPTAVLAGCGLGNTADTAALVADLLQQATCPVVLDADALNVLAGHASAGFDEAMRARGMAALAAAQAPLVLTPHMGEMARLAALATDEVAANQQQVAASFAAEHHCVVVLKGHRTVVAAPDGTLYLNRQAGNPGLAKGGSGDVLAGIIAGLAAQGLPLPTAAGAGVWLHAAAADAAAGQFGQAALLPADLPLALAGVLQRLGR